MRGEPERDALVIAGDEVARRITRFVADTSSESVPAPLAVHARAAVLDLVVRGRRCGGDDSVASVRSYVTGRRGREESTTFADGAKTTAFDAVLWNGAAAHASLAGERSLGAVVGVVPAALAMAEREHASGGDLVRAIVVGVELAARLVAAAEPSLSSDQGIQPQATLCGLAAAAACANLRGYDEDQVGNSMGIAATHLPTALDRAQTDKAGVAHMFGGFGAAVGIYATDFAEVGLTGLSDWVTPWFHALPLHSDLDVLVDGLGERWRSEQAESWGAAPQDASGAVSHDFAERCARLEDEGDVATLLGSLGSGKA
jgi:2-methylcitrate dehydratase PrpD